MKTSTKVVLEYLDRYPDLPSKSLAELIYKDNKELFTTVETVRTRIRFYRGSSGTKPKLKTYLKQNQMVKEKLAIPEGIASNRKVYTLPLSSKRVLVISDLHAPFHDKKAITTALDYAKKDKVDTIIINGDFVDFFAVSRWVSDPRKRDLKLEIDTAKAILNYIRASFPKALVIYKKGNHEDRLEKYLITKAPELLSLDFWQVEDILNFAKYNIIKVESLDYIQAGSIKIIHGHELQRSSFAPVSPARSLYLRSKESTLQSHVHHTSEDNRKNLEGEVTTCWSIGCLCDLTPDYMPYNEYNHGFAILDINKKLTEVHNKRIKNGKVV